ncbi:hypothetical protein EI94DRAFT_1700940 [Lactarius quietus]|nr:hypothetical protein EI94DRAFT_1700940 [Lactarius quietus]
MTTSSPAPEINRVSFGLGDMQWIGLDLIGGQMTITGRRHTFSSRTDTNILFSQPNMNPPGPDDHQEWRWGSRAIDVTIDSWKAHYQTPTIAVHQSRFCALACIAKAMARTCRTPQPQRACVPPFSSKNGGRVEMSRSGSQNNSHMHERRVKELSLCGCVRVNVSDYQDQIQEDMMARLSSRTSGELSARLCRSDRSMVEGYSYIGCDDKRVFRADEQLRVVGPNLADSLHKRCFTLVTSLMKKKSSASARPIDKRGGRLSKFRIYSPLFCDVRHCVGS